MILRQKAGVALMILFLPINGPLWRMFMEWVGRPIPVGEIPFLGISVLMFVTGTVMMASPGFGSGSDPVE
ncbi:MAG: hypothetical protein CMA88_03160 [Euryarchaeota archaeon]|nr:hypothetical protein [Euryarchaeota archaeon]|tara:strand:+ start:58 stop:267 length:210 start_codon:yes stop_codon:yes gene_type:complete